jgi:SNF2 family DNA or RNA helicase
MLILAPNGVHANWVEREIPAHCSIKNHKAFLWKPTRVEHGTRGAVEFDGFPIISMNHESLSTKRGREFILRLAKNRKLMVVVDESDAFGNPSSARTKSLLRLAQYGVYRLIMTGTLAADHPFSAWPQYEFCSPEVLGMNNYLFTRHYGVYETLGYVLDKKGNPVSALKEFQRLDELCVKLDKHRSRILKSECLDLPEQSWSRHSFSLPEQWRVAYQSLLTAKRAEYAGKHITPTIALTVRVRLQQIVCGFYVPDDTNVPTAFEGKNKRVETMMEVVERCRGKIVIWSPFKFNHLQIADALKEAYGEASVIPYIQEMSQDERTLAIDEFQDPGNGRNFFLTSQGVGGTGITLTTGKNGLYFANTKKLRDRLQTEARLHRAGQDGNVHHTDIEAIGTCDGEIVTGLVDKRERSARVSGDDLELVSNWLKL